MIVRGGEGEHEKGDMIYTGPSSRDENDHERKAPSSGWEARSFRESISFAKHRRG